MEERRLARIEFPYNLFAEMAQEGNKLEKGFTCLKGVPKDAVFIASYLDQASLSVFFIYSHPSFSLVEIGAVIPHVEFVYGFETVEEVSEDVRIYNRV